MKLLFAFFLPLLAHAELGTVEVAYRDASQDSTHPNRVVTLQGPREPGGFRFDSACGTTGANCECLFFFAETDPNPIRGTGTAMSAQQNALRCRIPGPDSTPGLVHAVAVSLRGGEPVTERVRVNSALTLEQILGPLAKDHVRSIFRYTCDRTFFEGEGVSPGQITCVGGQHLGVIGARYAFYTFRSRYDGNFPGGDVAFPSDICKRNDFLSVRCAGSAPELRYGFYDSAQGPFAVAVHMTRAPSGDDREATYGYAALPDASGECPLGLVKARPWQAQPASITQGSLDGSNPPSNFANSNNSLNDTRIETAPPANFLVTREPSLTPCAASGDCTNATFHGFATVQSVAYTPLTPVICVIPKEALGGLN